MATDWVSIPAVSPAGKMVTECRIFRCLLELADVLGVTVQELLEGSRREIESGNAGVVTYEGLHTVVQYLNQERAAWKKQIDSSLKFSLFCVGVATVGYVVMELLRAYRGIDGGDHRWSSVSDADAVLSVSCNASV